MTAAVAVAAAVAAAAASQYAHPSQKHILSRKGPVASGGKPVQGHAWASGTNYGWTGQQSGSGFSDIARPALGVFASLDRL
jgi:hypothetical protein